MALFALFTLGYIVGVWTACVVFRQPQRAYEQAVASTASGLLVNVIPSALHAEVTRL
ncbi:MAG TPA: hypothetical protein VGS16_05620 [Candidatus Dormibacteraeota bacterium]|nr:hypothetical protein [Candidatus Dormibacteraeota bacterium]